jgi:formylmethanofuran dehydrogenase subunit B
MTETTQIQHVTCLGCGCGCDDITVSVSDGRIVDLSPGCPVSRAWFGDGRVPWEIVRAGRLATTDEAIAEAATLLVAARGQCLVYIGTDLSSQAQRVALAIADRLRAAVDSATSATAAGGLLAAQRRGRAGATLGEIRNRGDVLLFWGVDPAQRYPRYLSRYALDPAGTHVPEGRKGRFVISVSIGSDKGPAASDLSLELEPEMEIAALSLMRAAVLGRAVPAASTQLTSSVEIATRLAQARYAVLVHDAEPTSQARDPLRVEGLIALTEALNQPTRAALSSLRAGGNRSGAEAVLTWQTGYPSAVEYSRGYPRYVPSERGLDRLAAGAFKAALVVGSTALDDTAQAALSTVSAVTIGPRASQAKFQSRVAIDTGIAGIHEGGTGYRMDEVPLPLRPPLSGQRSATETLRSLEVAIHRQLERSDS